MRRCGSCLNPLASKKAKCDTCGFDNSKIKVLKSAIKPGRRLDNKYYIGPVLGQGGFGITYKGFDEDLDHVVAIKEFFPKHNIERGTGGLEVDPINKAEFNSGLRSFTEEAKALARFRNHPNIVSVLSYFKANGTAYMVMEYIEGSNVRESLRGGKSMPVRDAVGTILPVLEGLKACHDNNLIHRDLTPDNIYITTSNQVKILDFGSARETKEGEDNEFTQVLKQSYAPIEQYQKGAQGPWTDIYSVGATLYRLLTGKPPALNAVERLISDTLKRPSEINKKLKINSQVEDSLMKALSVRPEQRYQHVDSFKADLLNGMSGAVKEVVKETKAEVKKETKKTVKAVSKSPKSEKVASERKSTVATSQGTLIGSIAAAALVIIGAAFYFQNPDMFSSSSPSVASSSKSPVSIRPSTTRIDPPTPKRVEPKKPSPKATNFSLVVNTYPRNARVRILGTPKKYTRGMNLDPGKYIVELWAPGYRIRKNTLDLKENTTLSFNLDKLKDPNVKVMNDFFELVDNPSTNAIRDFERQHRDFKPLIAITKLKANSSTFNNLKRDAAAGDAESNFLLGVAFTEGQKVKRNLQEATDYLEKAKAQQYYPAWIWLAKAYTLNPAVSNRQAEKVLDQVLNILPHSKLLLAKIRLSQGKTYNAKTLLQDASDQGVTLAHSELAELEYKSDNRPASIALWTRAANAGDTKAMIRLASLSPLGGSNSNKWLQKAYAQGDAEAAVFLALSSSSNGRKFQEFANFASKKGLPKGHFLKGWAHLHGIGTQRDEALAKEEFKKCNLEPNCSVMFNSLTHSGSRPKSLRILEEKLSGINTPSKRDDLLPEVKAEMFFQLGKIYINPNFKYNAGKAASYFEAASKTGSKKADVYLCNMYAYGIGVNKSDRRAFSLCSQAYSNGSKDLIVLNYLGLFHEKGLANTTVRIDKAKEYYNLACDLRDGMSCCNVARVYSRENNNNSKSLQQVASVKAQTLNYKHCRF